MMKSLFLFPLLLIMVFAVSCRHKGCTDPLASNYDKTANKANDEECEYQDEQTLPPCGDSLEFCMEYGSEYLGGDFSLSAPDSISTRMEWIDSTGTESRSFEITLYGNNTGIYVQKNDQSKGSFEANFFDFQSGSRDAISGEIEINTFSVAQGITGNFKMVMSDSTEIKKGFLNSVK